MGTDIHLAVEVYEGGRWARKQVPLPDDRNYWAFAILSDVRNGTGFAGCDLGDAVTPISEPRGIPEDCSIQSKEWLGDHSYSWILLSELLALDLDMPVTERGYVSPQAAEEVLATGHCPASYCGWTNQPGYVQVQWKRPLRECAFLIPKLIDALVPLGEPQHVRLVFGFDS